MTGKRPSRPAHLKGLHHIDPLRVIRTTVQTAETLASSSDLADFHDQGIQALDPIERSELAARLAASIAGLQQLHAALTDAPPIRNALRCKTCGIRFDAPRSDARYCSVGCRQIAYRASKKETK